MRATRLADTRTEEDQDEEKAEDATEAGGGATLRDKLPTAAELTDAKELPPPPPPPPAHHHLKQQEAVTEVHAAEAEAVVQEQVREEEKEEEKPSPRWMPPNVWSSTDTEEDEAKAEHGLPALQGGASANPLALHLATSHLILPPPLPSPSPPPLHRRPPHRPPPERHQSLRSTCRCARSGSPGQSRSPQRAQRCAARCPPRPARMSGWWAPRSSMMPSTPTPTPTPTRAPTPAALCNLLHTLHPLRSTAPWCTRASTRSRRMSSRRSRSRSGGGSYAALDAAIASARAGRASATPTPLAYPTNQTRAAAEAREAERAEQATGVDARGNAEDATHAAAPAPTAAALDEQFAAWDAQWSPSAAAPTFGAVGGGSNHLPATSQSLDDPFASARLDEQFEVWAASTSNECTPPLAQPRGAQLPSPQTRRRVAAFRSAPLGVHVPVITSVAPDHLKPVRRALDFAK